MYLKFTKAEPAIQSFQIKLTPCISGHGFHFSPCSLFYKYLCITAPCYVPAKVTRDEDITRVVSPWDSMPTGPTNRCPPACVPTLLLAIEAVNIYTLSNRHFLSHSHVHILPLPDSASLQQVYIRFFSLSISLLSCIFKG